MSDDVFADIAEKIIEQQEAIIGPVAIERARQVSALQINWPQHSVIVGGSSQSATIDELIEQYKELFGQIAVETCKEAVARDLARLAPDQVPQSLR